MVLDFGLYCCAHKNQYILGWRWAVAVLQDVSAVVASFLLIVEGVEDEQRWGKDHWRGAET